LLAVACGGTSIQGPGADKVVAHAGAGTTLGAVASAGTGGAAGHERPHTPQASAGSATAITPDDPSCPSPTVFAQTANIVGMQIALTATDVYWNDGAAIVRQAKAGGPAEPIVALAPGAARIAASGERLFWEAGSDVVSTMIAAPATGEPVGKRVLTGNWAVGGDQLYYLRDPLSGVGGTGGIDPNPPSTLETVPISGGPERAAVMLAASGALGPVTADATGAYWAYNANNDPAAHVGGGGSTGSGPGSRIQKLSYLTGEVSDFAPVGVIVNFNLVSNGDWVVWADSDPYDPSTIVYKSKPDGSLLDGVGQASIVRGLAVYGSTVYWAASHPGDDNSDIWSAQLAAKNTPQLVACQIANINGLRVDETDIYYFTWTAQPLIGRIAKPAP
jgi:hypothetical protein